MIVSRFAPMLIGATLNARGRLWTYIKLDEAVDELKRLSALNPRVHGGGGGRKEIGVPTAEYEHGEKTMCVVNSWTSRKCASGTHGPRWRNP